MLKKFTLLILLFTANCSLLTVNCIYAGDNDGTATAAFLRYEQGVRGLGMGGAFSGMDGDVESIWYNPAGAATIDAIQINASYSQYIEDIKGTYASIAVPKNRGVILGNINSINFGSIDALDATGAQIKSINLGALAYSAGYAMQLSKTLYIGAIAKGIQQNLGDDSSNGTAFDAGALFKMNEKLSFGICGQNFGSNLKTSTVENKLPSNIRAGISYDISPKCIVNIDAENPSDSSSRIHAGAELKTSDTFFLRAGYNNAESGGLSIGAGILTALAVKEKTDSTWWKEAAGNKDWSHNVVSIDYAYIASKTFDATHRVSFTIKF